MTTLETTTTTTATVKAGELVGLLKNVLPFAGTDATLPILCSVRLRLADGQLSAATTDRYTAARDHIGAEESKGAFEFILSVKDAKMLISSIGKTQAFEWAMLTPKDGRLSVTLLSGSAFMFAPVDGQWPVLDRLFEFEKPIEKAEVAFNPAYLARFAKVADLSQGYRGRSYVLPIQLKFCETGSGYKVHVAMGNTFTGLIVPVRVP